MPNLKQYSYKNYPVIVEVYILGQDVTLLCANLGEIGKYSDYPDLTEYRVGEFDFVLNDDQGDFSPNNDNNFFVKNGHQKDGDRAPVEVISGFLVNGVKQLETLFKGTIERLQQDGENATIQVECVDMLQSLTVDKLKNFGIQRHFGLSHDPTPESSNGEYPVLPAVLPESEDSAHVLTALGRENTEQVESLSTEGALDDLKYIITENKVITEGSIIENIGVGYPQIQLKSPFRYREISDIVSAILDEYSVNESFIELPDYETDEHFASLGRPGYDVLGISQLGTSNEAAWNGYVTDQIYDSSEDKKYYLYNVESSHLSMIIEYDRSTKVESIIYRSESSDVEFWRFAKNGNDFAILTTTGSPYDANEALNSTEIITWHRSSNMTDILVPNTESLKPQVAHLYGFGNRMFPDSRRPIIWYGNDLYYAYANSTTDIFGVAKVTPGSANVVSSVISANMDGNGNHAGMSFNIVGDILTGDISHRIGTKSRVTSFKKDLS